MQSVQRRFGKFLPRTADESQVSVLLKDFDDADRMLAKVHWKASVGVWAVSMIRNSRLLMHQKPGEIHGEIYWEHSNDWYTGFRPFTSP